MSGNDFGHLAYLGLLVVAVGSYVVVAGRKQVGTMARHAVLWALIFAGVVAVIGMWDNLRQTITPFQSVSQQGAQVTLPRARDGHYYAEVVINGTPLRFLVDTGASDIVLTREAAREVGIDPEGLIFSGRALTANGAVRTAPVRLDSLSFGGIEDRGVRAMVNDGELGTPLLGVSYLDRFSSVQIGGGQMVLTR